MFDPTFDLFLFTAIEGAGVRATKITADPAGHRDLAGVVVTAFGAGEALAGTGELAGKTTLVAFVYRGVGAVVGNFVVTVIPDIFQGFQIVLHVRVFAVADKSPARQRRIGPLEIQLGVRVYFLFYIQVEAVGVVPLVGDAIYNAKLLGIEFAKTGAEVFTRCTVEAEPIAGLFFPSLNSITQGLDYAYSLFTQLVVIKHMGLVTIEGINGFVHADKAQRNRSPTVLENLGHIIIGFQTYPAGAFHIEDGGNPGLDALQTFNSGHQCLLRQTQAVIQQIVEMGLITRLKSDAWQVEADNPQIIASLMDLLAILFIDTEEATAAHRRLEGAGYLDDLIVVENVWIHALGGALQCQFLDVVIDIACLVIDSIADGKDQFRENGSFLVLAEASNAIFQYGLLNQTRFPTGAQPKAEGDKRGLAIGGVQGVNFVFQRLEGVITLLFGAGEGKTFNIGNVPLFGYLFVFFVADGDIGGQHFINAVDGGATIDMAGNLGNDLGGDGCGRADRLGSINLGITHLEAMGQHAVQINQHAVEHGEEG